MTSFGYVTGGGHYRGTIYTSYIGDLYRPPIKGARHTRTTTENIATQKIRHFLIKRTQIRCYHRHMMVKIGAFLGPLERSPPQSLQKWSSRGRINSFDFINKTLMIFAIFQLLWGGPFQRFNMLSNFDPYSSVNKSSFSHFL